MKTEPRKLRGFFAQNHYLGPTNRGWAWLDEYGAAVWAKPTSRHLPQDGSWLELVRWCLFGKENGGSRQFKAMHRFIKQTHPEVTTLVSYSDPSVGHTGALYKACNWVWAPTWHRLCEPPTGNGSWGDGKRQAVKDRWVFAIRPDDRRAEILRVKDTRARHFDLPPIP